MVHAFVMLGWLVFSSVAFSIESEGLSSPRLSAGRCNLLTDDYIQCSRCCEADARAAAIGCTAVSSVLCKDPACRMLGTTFCGEMTASLRDGCLDQNCGGKSGNPSCAQPPPCIFECKFKCGLTERGQCGDCSYLNPDFVCCGG